MMICAMKVISVGFDMDAAASASAVPAKSDTEEDGTERDRLSGRGEARGRAVRKTVKSSGGAGVSVAKGGEAVGDVPYSGADLSGANELAVLPGWFEFAGDVNLTYTGTYLYSTEVGIANFFLSPLIANPLIFFESAKR